MQGGIGAMGIDSRRWVQRLSADQLRSMYLSFFEKRGHAAGMHPLAPVFSDSPTRQAPGSLTARSASVRMISSLWAT